jgi:chromosome segregation ATPase
MRIHASRVYTCRNMSSSTISSGISADEFQALEQKVLRAVEIVKREREARAAAEAEVASLREQLAAFQSNARAVEAELNTLNKERDAVRLRVEKMLQQMDELL